MVARLNLGLPRCALFRTARKLLLQSKSFIAVERQGDPRPVLVTREALPSFVFSTRTDTPKTGAGDRRTQRQAEMEPVLSSRDLPGRHANPLPLSLPPAVSFLHARTSISIRPSPRRVAGRRGGVSRQLPGFRDFAYITLQTRRSWKWRKQALQTLLLCCSWPCRQDDDGALQSCPYGR